MRGLSTSTASCPRSDRHLRPPPESQFFCGPEPPAIPRVPAVRHAPAQLRGLVTKPVPCSPHASLTEERLRARSPARDGAAHDPDEGTAKGTRHRRPTRRTVAGRGRTDTRGSAADPTRVRPAEPTPLGRRDEPITAPPSGSPAPFATGLGPTRRHAGSSMDSLAQPAPWAIRPAPEAVRARIPRSGSHRRGPRRIHRIPAPAITRRRVGPDAGDSR